MFRLTILIGVLITVIPVYGQQDMIQNKLAMADKLVAEKKYEEALKNVEAVLDIDELYLDALEKKVNIMLVSNNSKVILNEINEMIERAIQQPEYYYLRAIINNSRQRLSKAIEDFNNAVYYQMPENYMDRLYLNRGVAYYNIGDFELAELDYKNALDINPRYATVYHSWGMLDYEKGLFEDAVKKFERALQYGDERPLLFYNLGMSYLRTEEMAKACYNFNKSCSLGYKNACRLYLLECTE